MPNQDGKGRGQNIGVSACECPKCGHTETHERGITCTKITCPKCDTPMKGSYCK